jgi:hypothetical protein
LGQGESSVYVVGDSTAKNLFESLSNHSFFKSEKMSMHLRSFGGCPIGIGKVLHVKNSECGDYQDIVSNELKAPGPKVVFLANYWDGYLEGSSLVPKLQKDIRVSKTDYLNEVLSNLPSRDDLKTTYVIVGNIYLTNERELRKNVNPIRLLSYALVRKRVEFPRYFFKSSNETFANFRGNDRSNFLYLDPSGVLCNELRCIFSTNGLIFEDSFHLSKKGWDLILKDVDIRRFLLSSLKSP